MSSEKKDKLSIGSRMTEERERLGKTRAEIADACDKTPQGIGEFERGVSYPGGAVLASYAKLGADVQFILTGVRSVNLDRVAEEAGTYSAKEKKQGAGALSREEEVLVDKYRLLKPGDRTRAQAIVDALAAALGKKKDTG